MILAVYNDENFKTGTGCETTSGLEECWELKRKMPYIQDSDYPFYQPLSINLSLAYIWNPDVLLMQTHSCIGRLYRTVSLNLPAES